MNVPTESNDGDAGRYRPLQKYLRDRFADRVVLTFSQIEDLIGFPLPDPARHDRTWWDLVAANARRPAQSDAWSLASRTASVNLPAQTVAFERDDSR
jgi:hypothetical protein